MSILNSLFLFLTIPTWILFLKFRYTALLINLYNAFPSLSPFFFFCFHCFCVLNSTYFLVTEINWILIRSVFVLLLILDSSKISQKIAYFSLSKKIVTYFLTLPNRDVLKIINLIGSRTTFLFRFLFYLKLKDNHCAILITLYVIQDQLQEHVLLNYC